MKIATPNNGSVEMDFQVYAKPTMVFLSSLLVVHFFKATNSLKSVLSPMIAGSPAWHKVLLALGAHEQLSADQLVAACALLDSIDLDD